MAHQKRWTHDDDCFFVDLVAESVMENNLTLKEAIKLAAPELNRTEVACNYRWVAVIKQHLEGSELIERISENNPSVSKN